MRNLTSQILMTISLTLGIVATAAAPVFANTDISGGALQPDGTSHAVSVDATHRGVFTLAVKRNQIYGLEVTATNVDFFHDLIYSLESSSGGQINFDDPQGTRHQQDAHKGYTFIGPFDGTLSLSFISDGSFSSSVSVRLKSQSASNAALDQVVQKTVGFGDSVGITLALQSGVEYPFEWNYASPNDAYSRYFVTDTNGKIWANAVRSDASSQAAVFKPEKNGKYTIWVQSPDYSGTATLVAHSVIRSSLAYETPKTIHLAPYQQVHLAMNAKKGETIGINVTYANSPNTDMFIDLTAAGSKKSAISKGFSAFYQSNGVSYTYFVGANSAFDLHFSSTDFRPTDFVVTLKHELKVKLPVGQWTPITVAVGQPSSSNIMLAKGNHELMIRINDALYIPTFYYSQLAVYQMVTKNGKSSLQLIDQKQIHASIHDEQAFDFAVKSKGQYVLRFEPDQPFSGNFELKID